MQRTPTQTKVDSLSRRLRQGSEMDQKLWRGRLRIRPPINEWYRAIKNSSHRATIIASAKRMLTSKASTRSSLSAAQLTRCVLMTPPHLPKVTWETSFIQTKSKKSKMFEKTKKARTCTGMTCQGANHSLTLRMERMMMTRSKRCRICLLSWARTCLNSR